MKNLSPWLSSLIKTVVTIVVFAGSFYLSQGGAWQTITLGGAVTWALHWLETTFGITEPQA